VASPDNAGSTLYDDWLKESSKTYANGVQKPKIESLGSGSDFASFLQLYGISCTDIFYVSQSGNRSRALFRIFELGLNGV